MPSPDLGAEAEGPDGDVDPFPSHARADNDPSLEIEREEWDEGELTLPVSVT